MSVCACAHVHCTPEHLCGGQRTDFCPFCPSTVWLPGLELRSSDLTASAFTRPAISPALLPSLKTKGQLSPVCLAGRKVLEGLELPRYILLPWPVVISVRQRARFTAASAYTQQREPDGADEGLGASCSRVPVLRPCHLPSLTL